LVFTPHFGVRRG